MKKTGAKILAVSMVVAVMLTACGDSETYKYSNRNVVVTGLEKTNISQILKFSATLEGNKETMLAAKVPGQISKINVDIGDYVKDGAILASLTGEENFSERQTAMMYFQNAQSGYAQTKILMDSQVKGAEAGLETAKANLEAIKTALKNNKTVSTEQVEAAKLQFEMAQVQLDSIKRTLNQQEENVLDSVKSTVVQATILSQSVVSYLYNINGVQLPDNQNNFKVSTKFSGDYLATQSLKTNVLKAKRSSQELEDYYDEYIKDKDPSDDILVEGKNLALTALNNVKNAIQDMNEILNKSIIHIGLPESELNQYRASIVTYGTQIESMILSQQDGVAMGVEGVDQALSTLDTETQNAIAQGEKQLQLAEQNLKLAEEAKTASLDDLETKVRIAKANVAQAEEGLNSAKAQAKQQLIMAKTQLDAAQGNLNIANVMTDNTNIKAPYAGIISKKFLDEGAIVNAGTPILKIADISKLKLVIYVPEQQIKYFKNGQKATATSDSFPGETFKAVVKRIAPNVDNRSKKVRVELELENGDSELKIGMYMHIKFELEHDDSVYTLPIEAVQNFYGEDVVFIIKDGKVAQKVVKVGIANEKNIQIINGIAETDQVVVKGLTNLRDGDEVVIVDTEITKTTDKEEVNDETYE